MHLSLSKHEKDKLESWHKKEKDKRVADRIKVVLLKSENWDDAIIARALRIKEGTVKQHFKDYLNEKMKPAGGGSRAKLTEEQSGELKALLLKKKYFTTKEIRKLVKRKFKVEYSKQGIINWLKKHRFSYKKAEGVPKGLKIWLQERWVKSYEKLKDKLGSDEIILFLDSFHPSMATKLSYGWFHKDSVKPVKTTAQRSRLNITGAIDLTKMDVTTADYKTVNSASIIDFLEKLLEKYKSKKKIIIVMDNASCHKSKEVKTFLLKNKKIKAKYLPPYSPNLNAIEPLWKVVNKAVRNNNYFKKFADFKYAMIEYFKVGIVKSKKILLSALTDKFHIPKRKLAVQIA